MDINKARDMDGNLITPPVSLTNGLTRYAEPGGLNNGLAILTVFVATLNGSLVSGALAPTLQINYQIYDRLQETEFLFI